jgi:hypothetical protein
LATTEVSLVPGTFLQQTNALPSATLFRDYARYLLQSSVAWKLPVPLDLIRKRHGFQRRAASISSRGFLLGDHIFINSDDLLTVQRFTEAHELMETLVVALRAEEPSRIETNQWPKFEEEKEQWCEQGAAELLLPEDLFFPMVNNQGISLTHGRELAGFCQTSLTATLRRMLDTDLSPCVFAILREGHKKAQYVPSKVGQGVLWGNPIEWDPPAELRVWRRWSSPQVDKFVCINESFSRDGLTYKALHSGVVGNVMEDYDTLDLENIKGRHHIEAMLVIIGNIPSVMTLIHL